MDHKVPHHSRPSTNPVKREMDSDEDDCYELRVNSILGESMPSSHPQKSPFEYRDEILSSLEKLVQQYKQDVSQKKQNVDRLRSQLCSRQSELQAATKRWEEAEFLLMKLKEKRSSDNGLNSSMPSTTPIYEKHNQSFEKYTLRFPPSTLSQPLNHQFSAPQSADFSQRTKVKKEVVDLDDEDDATEGCFIPREIPLDSFQSPVPKLGAKSVPAASEAVAAQGSAPAGLKLAAADSTPVAPKAAAPGSGPVAPKAAVRTSLPVKSKSVVESPVGPKSNVHATPEMLPSDKTITSKGVLGKKVASCSKVCVKIENDCDKPIVDDSESNTPVKKKLKKEHPINNINLFKLINSQNQGESRKIMYPVYISSDHRRKLKNLVLNPANPNQFATSALDGKMHIWQIKGRRCSFEYDVDCLTENRKWPEDLAWEPSGKFIISVYNGDGADSQISITKTDDISRKVRFVKNQKVHVKGIINSVEFLPWQTPIQFATGGCDHAVGLWTVTNENDIVGTTLHKRHHTSAVSSVAGLTHKQVIMSAGFDKRLLGCDVASQRLVYQNMLPAKAFAIIPNPVDPNLLLTQIGCTNQQFRLLDYRAQNSVLHWFGYQPETSDSHTALIGSSWSPDGFLVVSGSPDPKIHLFDIRFITSSPAFSSEAHTKRVFKALWHPTSLLISISSDLQIGIHTVR